MKTTLKKFSRNTLLLGAVLVTFNLADAQTSSTTTTTTTTSAGTVSTLGPDSITLTTPSSPTPVRYTFSKTTTYVDENGNPVSVETVKSGLPVTVFYDRNGEQMVATKVVVKKNVDVSPDGTATTTRQTTTTTSSPGTVSTLGPDSITIRSETSSSPVTYTFSKTTTYVDENGNPVSVETVKSGAPVTVFYDRNGDQLVATRVVVKSADGAVTEKKTTTTETHVNP